MSKYEMANEEVGLGKTEDLGKGNLVNAFNILLRNGQEIDEEVMIIIEKRVVDYAQEL